MIFVFCAFMSIIIWICNWCCWYQGWCCFHHIFDPICDKIFVWWLSWIFLCGILACCIAGFVTANRLGFASYGVQCASERIYYDVLNGQLKSNYPKWEGTSNIKSYLNGLNNVYDSISIDETKLYFNLTSKNCTNGFIYPVPKSFADAQCTINEDDLNEINKKLYEGISSLYNIYKIKSFSQTIDTDTVSEEIKNIESSMKTYKSKIIDDIEYYIQVARGIGQIVPIIYFAILLFFVVGAGMLLIIYYCNCFICVNQKFYLCPMHLVWNIIRFFILSFFMYGFGFGGIFLFARDSIGYIQYIFSEDNIGTSSSNTIILTDEAKEFFNYCLNSGTYFKDVLNNKLLDDFIGNIIKFEPFKSSIDGCVGLCEDYRKGLLEAYPANNSAVLSSYKKVYESTGSIYSGLNCTFIQNNLNLLYRALWDLSWEARIMCALSCFIGFMGAIAVYGFLWSMYLWRNNETDGYSGYRYIRNGNAYNPISYNPPSNNNYKNELKSSPKKRKLKKPFIPAPKLSNDNYNNDYNNNYEMDERNDNDEEENEQ